MTINPINFHPESTDPTAAAMREAFEGSVVDSPPPPPPLPEGLGEQNHEVREAISNPVERALNYLFKDGSKVFSDTSKNVRNEIAAGIEKICGKNSVSRAAGAVIGEMVGRTVAAIATTANVTAKVLLAALWSVSTALTVAFSVAGGALGAAMGAALGGAAGAVVGGLGGAAIGIVAVGLTGAPPILAIAAGSAAAAAGVGGAGFGGAAGFGGGVAIGAALGYSITTMLTDLAYGLLSLTMLGVDDDSKGREARRDIDQSKAGHKQTLEENTKRAWDMGKSIINTTSRVFHNRPVDQQELNRGSEGAP